MLKQITIAKDARIHGVLEIESPGWDGKVFKMSRLVFDKWRAGTNVLKSAAVYVLYENLFERKETAGQLYVGHGAVANKRVVNHLHTKKWWTDVLLFGSAEHLINTAHAENIESKFINLARGAARYDVTNRTRGSVTPLGPEDERRVDEFVSAATELLVLAGIEIFTHNQDQVFHACSKGPFPQTLSAKILSAKPQSQIKILQGSRTLMLSDDEVACSGLGGIEKDEQSKVYVFLKDVILDVNNTGFRFVQLPSLSLFGFKNKYGTTLVNVLDSMQADRASGPPLDAATKEVDDQS